MIGIGGDPECRVEAAVLAISTKIVPVHYVGYPGLVDDGRGWWNDMQALSQCWTAAILKEHMNTT